MRYSHSALLAMSLLLLITSCKKDKTEEKPPDYMPLTAGSHWTYKPSTGANYTLTVTNKDTVALGRTYKILSNSMGINNYMARSANEYYRFGAVPGIFPEGFEELFLKDNVEVNTTWTINQPVSIPSIPIPLIATLKYTMKEKGISRTVNGKEFKEVFHVRMDVSIASFGSVGGGDFYYANHIGLIESALLISYMGQQVLNQSEVLVEYDIK